MDFTTALIIQQRDTDLIIYYLIITAVTFILWGIDKYRAAAGQWRIPEKVLLTLTVTGGAFGALAGMQLFRHKTRKPVFWITGLIAAGVHAWILAKWVIPGSI